MTDLKSLMLTDTLKIGLCSKPDLSNILYSGKHLNSLRQNSCSVDLECFSLSKDVGILLIISFTINFLDFSIPESKYIAAMIASTTSLNTELLLLKLSPF